MRTRAIVVFLGKELVGGAAWYTRFLKAGFVHCFVLIDSHGKWVKLEGRNGRMEVTYLGMFLEPISHYRNQGAVVVETVTSEKPIKAPLVARTCVGLIKAVLGSGSWAITPRQLYKHLTRG